jgi:bifunctional enzyme CysN/CysC
MTRFVEFQGGDVDAFLSAQENKDLLRFITCGSVDDGKSTLIGRLLYESKMLFEDQLTALEADSKRLGTQGGNLDFALLVDGLAAEREQGITIDVAYRAFTTSKRKFIVADTPGHEQYTRNMATGTGDYPDRRAQRRSHPNPSPFIYCHFARYKKSCGLCEQDGPCDL